MFPRRPRLVAGFSNGITGGRTAPQKSFCPLQVCERSTSPRWEEAFHYLVRDPRDESLLVKVSATVTKSLSALQNREDRNPY